MMPWSPMQMPMTLAMIARALEEAHHGHVVGQRFGGRNNLDELRLIRPDALENPVEILGGRRSRGS